MEDERQYHQRKELKGMIEKGGRRIYCILNSVSRSGMTRIITPYVIIKNVPCFVGCLIAELLDLKRDLHSGGVKVSGCGMDMGFWLVYEVGSVLYKGGDGKTITGRNGDKKPETDGGYLLKHIWL